MKRILLILITFLMILGTKAALADRAPSCKPENGCHTYTGSADNSLSDQESVMESQDLILPTEAEDADGNLISEGIEVSESYSGLPQRIQSQGERVFIFSPRLLKWAAYDTEGYLIATGKANGGSDFCQELGRPCHTPVGNFRVHSRGDASCVSRKFPLGEGGAPMPYCSYFDGGNAIHGSPYVSNGNTSHGCIRVHTPAAAWLHKYFLYPGTKVIVLPY